MCHKSFIKLIVSHASQKIKVLRNGCFYYFLFPHFSLCSIPASMLQHLRKVRQSKEENKLDHLRSVWRRKNQKPYTRITCIYFNHFRKIFKITVQEYNLKHYRYNFVKYVSNFFKKQELSPFDFFLLHYM